MKAGGGGKRVVSGGDRGLKSWKSREDGDDGEWRGDDRKSGFRAGRRRRNSRWDVDLRKVECGDLGVC